MDKFVEKAKDEVLYSYEGGSDDVRMMLSRGEANSRSNMEMGRFAMAVGGITSNWKGKWKDMFAELENILESKYMILNGYSRVQAIEMRGQSSIAGREVLEKKERGGLLGLISGK